MSNSTSQQGLHADSVLHEGRDTKSALARTFHDLAFLAKLLRPELPRFVASVAALAVGQLLLIVIAVLSIGVTVSAIAGTGKDTSWRIGFIFCAVALASAATLMETWWAHELAYKVLANIRSSLFGAIERISPLGLHKRRTADVAARAMGDVEQLEWFYAHTVGTAIVAVVAPIVATTYLGQLIGWPAVLLLVAVLVMVVPVILCFPLQRKHGEERRESSSALGVLLHDGIHGLREIVLLKATSLQEDRIIVSSKQAQRHHQKNQLRTAAEAASAEAVVSITVIGGLLFAAFAIQNGQLQRGDMPIIIVCITASLVPVMALVSMLSRCGEIGACATRVRDVLEAKSPVPETPTPSGKTIKPASPESGSTESTSSKSASCEVRSSPVRQAKTSTAVGIEFRHVSFGYDQGQAHVLTDFNLQLAKGKYIGVVGPSGVGKSTLSTLLMRFADPTHGAVCVDRQDLRQLTPTAHRERISLLPQSGHVFSGSVRENLLVADPQADDAEMEQALRSAGLMSTLDNFDGLATMVGDGNRSLSGGERQRLCLARAILRDSDVLVMDEPLANVDAHVEKTIKKALSENRSGKTTVMISHRVNHVQDADVIVVLEPGGQVITGDHQGLLESNDFYAQMCSQQKTKSAT